MNLTTLDATNRDQLSRLWNGSLCLLHAPSYRGKNLSQEALSAPAGYARQQELYSLTGFTEPSNIASTRALSRAGYLADKKVDSDGMFRFYKRVD
jgi:RimJ/RimL family protein N-acetyltransferase